MDYERIDINQCPRGEGNKGPNKFADTARCKKETTEVSFLDLLLNFGLDVCFHGTEFELCSDIKHQNKK